MAILFNESGDKSFISPDEGTDSFTLKQMQDYVGGGLVQYIPTNHRHRITAWCNEEGLIKSMKHNPVASNYLIKLTGVDWQLVGPVVIFGPGETDPSWSWLGIHGEENV